MGKLLEYRNGPTMKAAADACAAFGIACDVRVIYAHRTPKDLEEFATEAHSRGLRVIIAGDGGAAHLPGVTAAFTPLPVIGVPILGKALQGLDSLLSIVQMPSGVPVAPVAVNGARNAGLLAVQILAVADPSLRQKYIEFKGNRRRIPRKEPDPRGVGSPSSGNRTRLWRASSPGELSTLSLAGSSYLTLGRRARTLKFEGPPAGVAKTLLATLEGAMIAARTFEDEERLARAAEWLLASLDQRGSRKRTR